MYKIKIYSINITGINLNVRNSTREYVKNRDWRKNN